MVVPLPDGAVTGAAVFGKLPAHGDFIARGMTPDARDALDDWLSASMAAARTALGDGFDDAFDAAPPWRFVCPDEDGWVAGTVAPSVDGVGRRFPILARVTVPALDRGGDGAAHCEAAIYAAFDQGWDADALLGGASQPVDSWEDEWPGHAGWWTMGSGALSPATLGGDRPANLIQAMLTLPPRTDQAVQTEGAE